MARLEEIQAFGELVKAGLWEKEVALLPYGEVDYEKILRISEEQSVVGLVAAGIEQIKDIKIPQKYVLLFVGEALMLEKRNLDMNHDIEKLIPEMHKEGINTLLVKGQGIAQCYERPLWRACGDIDLFLDNDNYRKAKSFFSAAQIISQEADYYKHISFSFSSWVLELHGTLRIGLWKKLDESLDKLQKLTFSSPRHFRIWKNGGAEIALPSPNNDVIFVFTHILQHFFREGIGLRQICDWCRLIWAYRDEIDSCLLDKRIKEMRLTSEWKAFASLAVGTLGMPADAMPLYDNAPRWSRKARKILRDALESRYLGNNNNTSAKHNFPLILRKMFSFFRHTRVGFRNFSIFPLDTIKIWLEMIITGMKATFKCLWEIYKEAYKEQ